MQDILAPPGVKSKKDMPIYVPFIAGGIGGTMYWVFNYPIDYVKTLMQSDNFEKPKYKSTMDTIKQEYRKSGWKTFYRGYLICMMRSFPVNAAAVVTYRLMQRISGVQSNWMIY